MHMHMYMYVHAEKSEEREKQEARQMAIIQSTLARAEPQKSDPFSEEDESSSVDSSVGAEPPFTIATHSVKVQIYLPWPFLLLRLFIRVLCVLWARRVICTCRQRNFLCKKNFGG